MEIFAERPRNSKYIVMQISNNIDRKWIDQYKKLNAIYINVKISYIGNG